MQALTAIGITKRINLAVVCPDADLNTSESALFLDELPGMGADFFAPDSDYGSCDNHKSYISRLLRAREEALGLVGESISRAIKASYKLEDHGKYAWYIGQRQGIGLAQATQLVLKTAINQDAYLHLTQIGVVASGEGTATVTLTYPGATPQPFTLTIETSGYTGIPADVKLPLDGTHYTFETATTGTVRLQNNQVGCGCGAKDTVLYSYVKAGSAYAAGISLNAAVKCPISDVLSRIYTEDADVQKVTARMLYYRAGVVLCDYILGDVTPQESDTNLEYVKQKRANLLMEFEDRLLYLTETGIDVAGSACFACTGPRRVSIG